MSTTAVCPVCPHHCRIPEGGYGKCRARKHVDGKIICANYGLITSIALDPIEKKPLAYYYPGSSILSVGSFGCNMSCPFCQNYEIAAAGEEDFDIPQRRISENGAGNPSGSGEGRTSTLSGSREGRTSTSSGSSERRRASRRDARPILELSPEELCRAAQRERYRGNIGVAYTYNEAMTGYEFVRDSAKLVHEAGMKNVLVTNGMAAIPILEEVLPYIDAMNIDLKGFRPEIYRQFGGDLEIVKAFILRSARACHVELTSLIVPGFNDSIEDMEQEAGWIAEINPEIPLHITRYFPRYKMNESATDISLLRRLQQTARKSLRHVRLGNV